jgi:hypothetical protein
MLILVEFGGKVEKMYTLKSYNPKIFTTSKRGKIANFIHFFVDKVFNVNFAAIFSDLF